MGLSFKGLASNALLSRSNKGVEENHKDVADVPAAVQGHTSLEDTPDEKLGAPRSPLSFNSDEELNKVDTTAEHGVQAIQASTQVWSKRDLILAYIFMWLIAFMMSFCSSSSSTLSPYVTSSFKEHSLTALTSVISSIVAGIWKLPYAKIMNIWGRPFALCLGISMFVLGLILMATCNNVKAYCAAQTFFYTGYNSIDFFMTVFIADTSKLKNRGFFIGYAASPFLITTWIYGYAVQSVIAPGGIGFRWCFGIFAIIFPIVCIPFVFMFFKHEAKARRQGLIPPRPSRGSMGQTIFYYLREFDVVGLLILATGLALFLLAFNLYSLQAKLWKAPLIICFLIFGGLLIIAFGLWEKFFAPVTFIPWPLLKNRTVIFTYTMVAAMYTAWYIWDSYFYSLLRVMFNQSVPHATYIANIYTMGSCFICLVYGVALRYYGKLKIWSLFWGAPLMILGVGLMIKFRQPDENIGYIVMCMIFIAFGGGVLVTSEQTTIMAVSKQQDFPALLAVESMIVAIGNAIGSTIAGAIWTGIFPVRLMANLPADAQADFASIYGDIDVQTSYAVGTPTRDAINLSYGETQRYMLISATCVYIIVLFSIAMWQNVDVRTMKQRTIGLL
ncbi:siderophore iron transporter-like protein [Cucurbitaria berberidis CBS 394.84]|uniref:Siderophore iron transporter-like protein n=1 Tax=Cucurbitaria berberidis CBS 394.84 TaxID=1168544 RepID=A0A9P4GSC9_9PLEO|nr:siderophore iron transporter-like protein [Cucurbitaria berberidis CBS 394.84]KAF1850404.1 siderophore iron transporter-like protein [Cucurbitaria berberidis CBS 394.84]